MNNQLNSMNQQSSGQINPNEQQALAQFFALNAAQQFANMAQMANPDFMMQYQQELANASNLNKQNNFANQMKNYEQALK